MGGRLGDVDRLVECLARDQYLAATKPSAALSFGDRLVYFIRLHLQELGSHGTCQCSELPPDAVHRQDKKLVYDAMMLGYETMLIFTFDCSFWLRKYRVLSFGCQWLLVALTLEYTTLRSRSRTFITPVKTPMNACV